MADTATIRYEIDFKKLVENAEAAGFNPLTVLRNGAASGFAVEHHPIVPMGSFTSGDYAAEYGGEYGGGEFTSGGGGGGDSGFSYPGASYWDEPAPGIITSADGSTRPIETRPARESVWDNTASAMITGPSGAVIKITGSGAPAGRVASSASPATSSSAKAKVGFQTDQAYDKSKIPNIVENDVWHYILPGVAWLESGGTTRAQTWEDGYGEEGLASALVIPKLLNDVGKNVRRALEYFMFQPMLDSWKAGSAFAAEGRPADRPPIAVPGDYGQGYGGGFSWSPTPSAQPYRATASYAASKSATKAATGQSYSQPSKAESKAQSSYNQSKAESKAQSAKSESKSSGSSGGKKK